MPNCQYFLSFKFDYIYLKILFASMHKILFFSSLLLVFSFFTYSCQKQNDQQQTYQIADGFNCELVVSEPLVFDPVDLEFDENGEAFVLEMPGYPLEKEQSMIIHLIDENDDGVYDKKETFAENLNMATSILPYKKGFLVAAPPFLLHVQDLDGNYKAEKIDTLMGGFSKGNLQHNFNGLTFGLDGWIYAANGGNSGEPYWWPNEKNKISLKGQDFRFNINKRIFELTGESAGGFGITMDEYGHIFGTHNMEHVTQLVYNERYRDGLNLLQKHNLSNISDHEEAGTARIYPIGEQESRVNHPEQAGYFSGGCGICYYGGGAFGEKYQNTIWVNDVVLNLVHVDKLSKNGAILKASRLNDKKEIWANANRESRPVNMTVGPDGAIYLVDMYRKVIEHPEWIPDDLEAKMDLNAGKEKGRIYRISKSKNKFYKININDIDASFSHPNQWVRNTTHRLLLEQELTDIQVNELTKILKSNQPLARLHAMWVLSSFNKLPTPDLLTMVNDMESGNRENALKIAENRLENDLISTKILELLNDSDQRVRMQAALSLSKAPEGFFQKKLKIITQAISNASQKEIDQWNVAALTTVSAPISLNILKSLPIKNHNDLLISIAGNLPSDSLEAYLSYLESIKNETNLVALMLEQHAKNSKKISINASTQKLLIDLESTQKPSILKAGNILRKQIGLPPSIHFKQLANLALTKSMDAQLTENERLEQLALLESLPYSKKRKILFECLNNKEPINIQIAALKQLYSHNNEPSIASKILEIWPNLGPLARKSAGDILLYTEQYNDVLLSGLEQGKINIGEMNFDLERRRQLLFWNENKSISKRAEALFKDSGVSTRKQALAKMQPALELKGSPKNGANVFLNTCSSCHQFGKLGNEVGPNLTEISRKSKASNLHDIVDPNAATDTKFISHQLETMEGKIIIGIVSQENDQFIELKQMGAVVTKIAKKDIKKLKSLGKSYMIEGLEAGMSHQNMADLLEYFQNFKIE
jgi:putative membrane-bound dehydrogenase-like protein